MGLRRVRGALAVHTLQFRFERLRPVGHRKRPGPHQIVCHGERLGLPESVENRVAVLAVQRAKGLLGRPDCSLAASSLPSGALNVALSAVDDLNLERSIVEKVPFSVRSRIKQETCDERL